MLVINDVINPQAVLGEYAARLLHLVGLCHASYGLEIDDLRHPFFGKDMMAPFTRSVNPSLSNKDNRSAKAMLASLRPLRTAVWVFSCLPKNYTEPERFIRLIHGLVSFWSEQIYLCKPSPIQRPLPVWHRRSEANGGRVAFKEGQFAEVLRQLQPDADRPDFLQLQRAFLPNNFVFFPKGLRFLGKADC